MWWRGSIQASVDNVDHDTIQILSHVIGRNPQRFDSLHSHPRVSPLITIGIVTKVVRHPIDFNCETSRFAEEIEYEWAERMLAAELKPAWAQLQDPPEPDLGRTHAFSKLARLMD